MFSWNAEHVVLVRKKRPTWQAGLWNGVGGSIELETPSQAMCREFREETGVQYDDWRHFCTLRGKQFEVWFYCAMDDEAVRAVRTTTDEIIGVFTTHQLPQTLPNLNWLIPMAMHEAPGRGLPFTIMESE